MRENPGTGSVFRVTLSTPLGTSTISAGRNEHLWDAAQAAGIVLPAICHQGRCLTCAGKLLQPGDFDPSDAEMYFPEDREAGFVLLCTAKPRSDLHIQTHAENEMRKHRLARGLPAAYA
jgi:ferredoxin